MRQCAASNSPFWLSARCLTSVTGGWQCKLQIYFLWWNLPVLERHSPRSSHLHFNIFHISFIPCYYPLHKSRVYYSHSQRKGLRRPKSADRFRLEKYRADKHGLHNRSRQDGNSRPIHAPPKYNESFHIYLSIIQAKPLCDAGRFCCTLTLRLSFCYRLKFLQFGAIIRVLFLEKIPERVKIWDIRLKRHSM